METRFDREIMLIGEDNFKKLAGLHVAIFGIGGVGGGVLEALVRAGISELTIVDSDRVNITNLNRQLISNTDNIGELKVDAAEKHALEINPDVIIHKMNVFFSDETLSLFDFGKFDFVADCIDSVDSKILLIKACVFSETKIISSMGTGNKLHPEMLELSDISKTCYCPLAKVVRARLRKEGINHLPVVFSKECRAENSGRGAIGSTSFVPPVAGFLMGSFIINSVIDNN